MRRRRPRVEPGFAILRSDALWYGGRDSKHSWWVERLHEDLAIVFDHEKDAAGRMAELAEDGPGFTYEIVPVNREAVFGG